MQTETKLEISELLFQFTLASVSECVISLIILLVGQKAWDVDIGDHGELYKIKIFRCCPENHYF